MLRTKLLCVHDQTIPTGRCRRRTERDRKRGGHQRGSRDQHAPNPKRHLTLPSPKAIVLVVVSDTGRGLRYMHYRCSRHIATLTARTQISIAGMATIPTSAAAAT